MADYIADVLNQTSKLDWAMPLQRTGAFPIDRSTLFSSYADAVAYARGDGTDERGLGGASYVGQIISVYEAATEEAAASINAYIITPDRALSKLAATAASGDVEADLLLLQARVDNLEDELDKIISDIEHNTTSISQLDSALKALEATVDTQSTAIDQFQSQVDDLEAKDLVLSAGIESLELALENIYTKEQTDLAISEAVADANHLKRVIVDSVDEINIFAIDAEEYIYMVPREDGTYEEYMVLNNKVEKVGDWKVDLSDYVTDSGLEAILSDYALSSDVAKKVDAEDGKSLVSNDLIYKLENIEAGAQENYVSAVTSDFVVVDGELGLAALKNESGETISLVDALNNKVDKVDGSRLLTNDEAIKLTKIVTDENGKVGIEAENVLGLDALLNNKVNAVEGMGLSEVNFTTELFNKLVNIENNANENIIEAISLNGVDLDIIDKKVNISVASNSTLGVVKSTEEENSIAVDEDGKMTVHSLNVNKLVQNLKEWITLNGGDASEEV